MLARYLHVALPQLGQAASEGIVLLLQRRDLVSQKQLLSVVMITSTTSSTPAKRKKNKQNVPLLDGGLVQLQQIHGALSSRADKRARH